jgi:diguanylate cyclase (GGDEF)-like protein
MHINLTNEHWAFLSRQSAGRRETRFALAAVLVSVAIFLVAAPFARTPLTQVPAFIPMYVASLVICDLITAALLFGQFSVLRSWAILVLAGGYLFTASITFAYALIFPGLFSLPGLPVAGAQTSSAMYMFWHSGFPLIVIAYTRFKPDGVEDAVRARRPQQSVRTAITAMIAAVLAIVIAFTLFATWGRDYIPMFLDGNRTTVIGHVALVIVWTLSLAALLTLWRRKPHTVLDVWLLVVMCVWLCDIALAAILNTGRYDLGWYVGRIYGLLAASFLLIVLLLENARQYARLVQMSVELSTANKALAELSRQDGLTGLANRRSFDEYLVEQIALASRQRRELALVLCDVDHFKGYNDLYGHQGGDECLRRVAAALHSCCRRPADLAARYGGEEFAIILPDTDLAGAVQVAEAAKAALANIGIPHANSAAGPLVSISCGVAVLLSGSAQQLIASADQALYQAKDLGRNRVVGMQPEFS